MKQVIEANILRANIAGPISSGLPKPSGNPPDGALKDKDGYFIVDRNGKYIVTTES